MKTTPKPKFRLRPPNHHTKPLTWATPFITETISGTALILTPAIVGNIINNHTTGNTHTATQLTLLLITLILILTLNEKIGWGTLIRTQIRLERDWRHHTNQLTPHLTTHKDPGAIIATMNKDTKAIANLLMPMNSAFSAIAIATFGTIQLWTLSPLLALTTLLGVTLTITTLTLISKTLEKRAETFRSTITKNTSKASDIATAIRTIIGLGATHTMLNRYTHSAHDVRNAQLHYERTNSWSAATRVLLIGTTTITATALALQGNPTNNTWTTTIPTSQLITVTGIISMMVGPVWAVENFLRLYRDAKIAHRRIHTLEQDTTNPTTTTPTPPTPQLLTQLHKSLTTGNHIHYLNPRPLDLTAQQHAQTLTHHLRQNPQTLGLTNPNHILHSQPNPTIFAGTLHQHLHTGNPNLTPQNTQTLLTITDSHEIAHRLGATNPNHHHNTTITPEGTNLSGGQRQRLALARTLAQQKPALILTEPLNSVDQPSQHHIYNQLEQHTAQPGPLKNTQHIIIISTTEETTRRARRDLQEATSDE